MACVILCQLLSPPKIKRCPTHYFNHPVLILPPPPPPPPANNHQPTTLLLLSLLATATLVGAIFMLCLLFKKLRDCRSNSDRNRSPLFHVREQSFSDQGPIVDHHVWHINTVGLHQSVIDSISMFKYRKSEKLIDGSDCSICLGEFQDDESLRLLPRCSHAFHVPCIDTWLRSHKNCPLCRASVMSDPAVEPAAVETEEENRVRELENSQILNQSLQAVENEELSAIREEGSSSSTSTAISSSKKVEFEFEKMGIGNQGLCNLVKSISFGRCVTKGAISMKRFSSGRRKLKGIRHYRSQSSVLPL